MFETASLISDPPTAEAYRVGVYVMAAIFGLFVCGLIAVIKELRGEMAARS